MEAWWGLWWRQPSDDGNPMSLDRRLIGLRFNC
jgi:hypothetical protein